MTEPTAKRIAKSLEILANQTSGTQLDDIAKKLSRRFSKSSTVRIIECITDLKIGESKDIADRYYK